nr:RNA-dependent RNA polymerase [Mute swan feces associated partitiviridae F]
MPTQLYSGDPFFQGWRSKPYIFESEEAKAQFKLITNSMRPKWIEWDLFYHIKRMAPSLGLNAAELEARSKYNPDMFRPHCRKWEEGQASELAYDHELFSRAVASVNSKFSLLEKVKPIAYEEVPWKEDTNFGAPTFSNSRHDKFARDKAIAGAKAIARGKSPEPFVAYARGKNEEEARITLAEPKAMFIVGGRFFYPYFRALKAVNSPYAGCAKRQSISARVNELKWNSRFVLAADYSRYDSTIPQVLTSCAFKIIKNNFVMTKKEEALWETYVAHFNTNGMLMPDGNIYYGRKGGVPSGAIFTSIIGSIVNAIIIEYCALRGKMLVTDYLVLGDDSIIGLTQPTQVEAFTEYASELGIIVSQEDSKLYVGDEKIYFLGHFWEDGCSRRDIKETIYRLCCPENIKPWNRAKFGSTEYCLGLFDKIKDYQNDNEWFWSLGNMIIDSFLVPEEPWLWGEITRRNFFYTNMVLDQRQQRDTGLKRLFGKPEDWEGSSLRLAAVY